VFGAKSDRARASLSKALLKYGFRNFVSVRPAARDLRRQVDVFSGKDSSVWLVPDGAVWITVPKGYVRKVHFELTYPAPLQAPLSKGQAMGTLKGVVKGERGETEEVASIPMVTAAAVAEAGWIGRTMDRVKLWLNSE